MKKYLGYAVVGVLGLLAMVQYARANEMRFAELAHCSTADEIVEYTQRVRFKKEPWKQVLASLPGCQIEMMAFIPISHKIVMSDSQFDYDLQQIQTTDNRTRYAIEKVKTVGFSV